jgi:hypothetical protein
MGGEVKAQLSRASEIVVLISGVHVTVRRVGTGQIRVISNGAVRPPMLGGSRCRESVDGFGIEAVSFSVKGREPSFYPGFCEPLLRSELRRGIA